MSKTERWPPSNQDEGKIRAEMLENPGSLHWKGCLNRVTELVHWQMMKTGLPRHLEEDIIQEVMLKVIRYLPLFRGQGRLERWLCSIVRNTLIDAQRRCIPDERYLLSLEDQKDINGDIEIFSNVIMRNVEEECIAREDIREVLEKIQIFVELHWSRNLNLRERNSMILRAVLINDQSCKEVAQAHRIHPQSIYILLRDLRRSFE